ncbi:sensor histidine kinase [Aliivibrio kagoshimensis]|uniref:sensor histidine kinase n=1 Tax=Aliivibrio kagoshimensis TaxID=2910230 RepID=UPI003D0D7749
MNWLLARLLKRKLGNSIDDVKKRLLFVFSVIALSSSFLVFFSFSLYLVLNEEKQLETLLTSFEQIGAEHYGFAVDKQTTLGTFVNAYYSERVLPLEIKNRLPLAEGEITRFRKFDADGFLVFHSTFVDKSGRVEPLYLTVGNRDVEFGDDGWEGLIFLSLGLMLCLIAFLRKTLSHAFGSLMSPISQLSEQLKANHQESFEVSKHAIDEIKLLTQHLNSYKQMKERLAKQEMMFAKYASHELKTPIAVVLGAANLQAMKEDPEFQQKQRERILTAANNMQATVEVLLNIVKQENVPRKRDLYPINVDTLQFEKHQAKLNSGVSIECLIEPDTQTNMPPSVLVMIIKNLLDNAIRFTHQGTITLSIETDTIKVTDTGSGLTDNPDTEHGLGLLIVKRLCDSYGWHFNLSNQSEGGCCAKLQFKDANNSTQ